MLLIRTILSFFLIALSLVNCGGGGGSSNEPAVTLNSISLNSLSKGLKLNETFQLVATGLFSDTSTQTISQQVSWSSSDTNIITVSASGLITAVSSGTANVSASLNSVTANISVTAITLINLAITPASATLEINSSQQFTATGQYSDNSTDDVTDIVGWTSGTPAVATISASGSLTALSAGATQVSATINGLNSSVTTNILVPTLNSISLNSLSKGLKLNETFQLVATGLFSDTSTQTISQQVSWSSSDTNIITVSYSGLITAVSSGTTSISASLNSVTANTSISAITLVDLTLSPSLVTLAINSSQQFSATGRYSDNSTDDLTSTVIWSSNTPAVATISASGSLTAVTAGTTQVFAAMNGLSSDVSVNISSATLQAIDITTPSSIAAGLSRQLVAIGTFSDGSTQIITSDLSWQSSHSSIASVDAQTALLSTIQQGSTTITATNGSLSTTAIITVSPATLSSISITPSVINLPKGSTKTVNVTALFSDLTVLDISNQVTWVSSNSNIAQATNNTSQIEGNAIGANTLTATFSNITANLNVTVSNAALTELSIFPINASLPKGLTQAFTASGLYTDGSVQNLTQQVTWISSDTDISTIDNASISKGIANGIAAGAVSITASLNGIDVLTAFTINNTQLDSIEIIPNNTTALPLGINIQASAIGHFADGSQLDISHLVTWGSSDNDIAKPSTSTKGLFETLSTGDALMSAIFNSVSTISHISVSAATLESINISSSIQTLPIDFELTLKAIGVFSDNSNHDISHQVAWQSTDDSIMSVDKTNDAQSQNFIGLIRANSVGNATISASLNGQTGNIAMSVSNAVLSQISISSNSTSLNITASTQATATGTYSDNSTLNITKKVFWSNSDTSLASVNQLQAQGGLITGLSVGNVQFSASLMGITSSNLAINVISNPNAPSKITLSLTPNAIINNTTDNALIQATITPTSSSGAIIDGTSVSFEITENGITRIETALTSGGVASINLTSSFDGFINVKASYDSNITAQSGVFSAPSFLNIIVAESKASTTFINGTLKKDSLLVLLLRNISNRELTIPDIFITQGNAASLIHLHDSPLTDSESTSDHNLSGGEFTGIGYSLDSDIVNDTFNIIYHFTEASSSANFLYISAFTF